MLPSAPPPATPHRAQGLEWLPASAHQPLPDQATAHEPAQRRRPLVIILPWMWAARAAVARHAALYHSLGCDVAVFHGWPALSVWLPPLARRNAAVLLTALSTHLREQGPRDVLLACFSGAAKGVLCPLLERLVPGAAAAAGAAAGASEEATAPAAAAPAAASGAFRPLRFVLSLLPGVTATTRAGQQQSPPPAPPHSPPPKRHPQPPPQPEDPAAALLLRHLRGVLLDSGPVDFDSSVGVRLFANSRHPGLRRLQATAGAAAAGALDFCLHEAFESQRVAMWVGLRCSLAAAALPVAFLYSWSGDALADPQPIHALAAALREDAAAAAAGAAGGGANGGGGWEGGVCGRSSGRSGGAGGGGGEGAGKGGGRGGEAAGGGNAAAAAPGAERWPKTLGSGNSSSTSTRDDNGGVEGDGDTVGRQRQSPADRAAGSSGSLAAAATQRWLVPPAVCGAPSGAAGACPPVRVRVWEQGWDCSPHVAHLREHPEQYRRVVAAFLEHCLGKGLPTGGSGSSAGLVG